MRHTPAQQRATETINQDLKLIACSGSGKTRAITNRLMNRLRTRLVQGVILNDSEALVAMVSVTIPDLSR
jgi:ATP-dependent exoDNAse (exonuclease V) beta subunit